MNKYNLALIILMMVTIVPPVRSQVHEDLTGQLEYLIYDQEESTVETSLCEELQDLLEVPLDLNSATGSRLESSGLFTFYQVHKILEYREKHGMLLSVYELGALPGFSLPVLEKIAPYITASLPVRKPGVPGSRTTMEISSARRFPLAKGYAVAAGGNGEKIYPGSPWKTSLRIRTIAGPSLSLGFACGKDPGERGFTGPVPEQTNGYLSYEGAGKLERFIVGSFRLQHGPGLLQGSGSFLSSAVPDPRTFSVAAQKPYAGLSTHRVHQGILVRFSLSKATLSLWSSFKKLDLSFYDLRDPKANTDWVLFRRESGMHRTSSEILGRNLGYLGNAGMLIQWHSGNLTTCLQWSSDVCGLTQNGRDSLKTGTAHAFHHAAGLYWTRNGRRMVSYGEVALGMNLNAAVLTGLRHTFNAFLTGGIQLHYYSKGFRDVFASVYGSSSHIRNESGIMLFLDAAPAPALNAVLSLETFRFPGLAYLTDLPSSMVRCRLILRYGIQDRLKWQLGISCKTWQTTEEPDGPGAGMLVRHDLVRAETRIILDPGGSFRSQARLAISFPGAMKGPSGMALMQQASAKIRETLSSTLQFVVFRVPEWDQRICIYEPGLYHQFSFPVYHGTGQKLAWVLSYRPVRWITLGLKFSAIRYDHQDAIGSGNEMVEGNRRWETGGQLRFRF
jgi:hypothetical protein